MEKHRCPEMTQSTMLLTSPCTFGNTEALPKANLSAGLCLLGSCFSGMCVAKTLKFWHARFFQHFSFADWTFDML